MQAIFLSQVYEALFGTANAPAFVQENPFLAAVIIGIALASLLAIVVYAAIRLLPSCSIAYRAWGRILWVKFGSSAVTPPMTKRYAAYLKRRHPEEIRMAVEGAGFGYPGYIYLTSKELGFAMLRFGVMTEMTLPYDQILETSLTKGGLYDTISIATRTDDVRSFRIFKSVRDVAQDFFNHLQVGLGAIRLPSHLEGRFLDPRGPAPVSAKHQLNPRRSNEAG
jgi:hypothetical protein